MRTLVAIPVYNEERTVQRVLAHVLQYIDDVVVIDDGSTDKTVAMLPKLPVDVIRHARNRGYGHALRDAFAWADIHGFDWIITMDCDEQHEPQSIPAFLDSASQNRADIISGSRYLATADAEGSVPADRREINATMTQEINTRLGLKLTDSFCGFKAHRVDALRRLKLSENGYAFPMQFWTQIAAQGLRVEEIPVKRIYTEANRTFGAGLDDPEHRLRHYRNVLNTEIARWAGKLPPAADSTLRQNQESCWCPEQ